MHRGGLLCPQGPSLSLPGAVQPRRAESTTASTRPSRQSVLWPRCSGTVLARQLCCTRSHPSVHISAASGPHPGKQQTGGPDPPGSEPSHPSAQVGNPYAHWLWMGPRGRQPVRGEAACLCLANPECVAHSGQVEKGHRPCGSSTSGRSHAGTAVKLLTTPCFSSGSELLSQVPCVDETGPRSIQKSVSSD